MQQHTSSRLLDESRFPLRKCLSTALVFAAAGASLLSFTAQARSVESKPSVLVDDSAAATGAEAVSVTAVRIPVNVPAEAGTAAHVAYLAGNIYQPQGAGPWGLIVLSHGTPSGAEKREALTDRYGPQAKALALNGYVVITALRRGYGASDGPLVDRYGSCDSPNYLHASQESARDVAAVLAYGQQLSQVDAGRVVLVGKSAGGFASLALAAQVPRGLLGVVNFAGGRGSQAAMRAKGEICGQSVLLQTVTRFASTTAVPQLWIYAENDHYFAPPLVRKMAEIYQQAAVPLEVKWMPPSGKEGHRFFDIPANTPQWLPLVQNFLARVDRAPIATAQNAISSSTSRETPNDK